MVDLGATPAPVGSLHTTATKEDQPNSKGTALRGTRSSAAGRQGVGLNGGDTDETGHLLGVMVENDLNMRSSNP